MNIEPVSAFSDNYIWMLIDEKNHTAICVDPGDASPVLRFLQHHGLDLNAIMLTHHHFDHTGGVGDLHSRFPDAAIYGPNDTRISHVTHILHPDDLILLDSLQFKVLGTPGHTSTHISLYEENHGLLFCGDTLFSAGCGRVFDGTMKELHDSLHRLKSLPDQTKIYCAHEYTRQNLRFAATVEPQNQDVQQYLSRLSDSSKTCTLPSTIAREKTINPFFRTHSEEVQDYVRAKGGSTKDSLAIFTTIREGKDHFS
ncbi:hydroxyacylglutathione hydrolase [Legionella spiritensis]|uniref:Hydroxyacylglutathione hydrolase n=1 Tax=Legionella spiritensis TaxID=452 RepID=A0A0W0Z8L7_LEGSP|nr:hydroxyacylglutathione hydrolase [Legionella spiritensis]KTD65472.1 hydroxyacylglutathione hydrolase (glyoxalase II) [Legionella spiritensis]SNV35817.1 hydroxyacylglutathione hydrolase [Legionella spiritensis]